MPDRGRLPAMSPRCAAALAAYQADSGLGGSATAEHGFRCGYLAGQAAPPASTPELDAAVVLLRAALELLPPVVGGGRE